MRKDSVYQYVLTACAQQDPVSGVTAQEVANALGIWRNDATVDLNKLVADGMLCRQGKRDVHFFPAVQTSQVLSGGEAESADNVKAFSNLVGADGSLKRRSGLYQQSEVPAAHRQSGRDLSPLWAEYAHHRPHRQRQKPFCPHHLGVCQGDRRIPIRPWQHSLCGLQLCGIYRQPPAFALPSVRIQKRRLYRCL